MPSTASSTASGSSPAGRLDAGAAQQAAFQAFQKLKGAAGSSGPNLAGAMEQGSAAAYSAIVQFQANGGKDVQQEIKQILMDQKFLAEEANRIGREVLKARANLKLEGVEI